MALCLTESPLHPPRYMHTHVQPSGKSLTNYVVLLWVAVGQPWSRCSGSLPSWSPEGLSRSVYYYYYYYKVPPQSHRVTKMLHLWIRHWRNKLMRDLRFSQRCWTFKSLGCNAPPNGKVIDDLNRQAAPEQWDFLNCWILNLRTLRSFETLVNTDRSTRYTLLPCHFYPIQEFFLH